MKKICFLGDSIRMNYAPRTMALLGDGYTYISPTDNCRFAKYTSRMIFDMRRELAGASVIHYNNGLWDLCDLWGEGTFTPIDEYVATVVANAKRLLTMTDTLIFATTTPVRPENPHDSTAIIRKANAAVLPELRALGVVINDLYTVIAADIPRYICDDYLHLSEEGKEVAAQHNAALIQKYL